MSDFNNKVVIVTGGGTGIGRAITETFAKKSAKVLITGRREGPLKELSQGFPEQVSFIQTDVAKAEDRKKIIQTAIDRYGQIDVLVNNAALGPTIAPLKESSDEDFIQAYLTNLVAPASLIREAIPHLGKTKGTVINISTIGARTVKSGMLPYTCSKAALDHLTRNLATELGPLEIRVNVVAPGMTKTDMAEPFIDQMGEMMVSMTPLQRLGKPVDIARSVLLLASDEAGWVTGQILDASGGFML